MYEIFEEMENLIKQFYKDANEIIEKYKEEKENAKDKRDNITD